MLALSMSGFTMLRFSSKDMLRNITYKLLENIFVKSFIVGIFTTIPPHYIWASPNLYCPVLSSPSPLWPWRYTNHLIISQSKLHVSISRSEARSEHWPCNSLQHLDLTACPATTSSRWHMDRLLCYNIYFKPGGFFNVKLTNWHMTVP